MSAAADRSVVAAPVPRRGPGRGQFAELSARFFPLLLGTVLVLLLVLILVQKGGEVAGGQLRNGVVQGAIYALIAVGYTMVYGIIELINFAHGDVFALSAFYALLIGRFGRNVGFDINSLATTQGPGGTLLALLILLPLTMLLAGLTGMLIERVAYRPLRSSPRLAPLITAIGVSFLIEGLIQAQAGGNNVNAQSGGWISAQAVNLGGCGHAVTLGDTRCAGGVGIGWKDMVIVGLALGLMFALQAFVTFTKLGKAMRATAQDRDAALLAGININRTISATFFIGSALAGAGAIVWGIYNTQVRWDLGFRVGIVAFTAAVLGGIGNIVGAGLGGFLIGIITVFGGQLLGAQWGNSVVFIMLIVVLTLRPVGLLGMRVPDRA